MIRAANLPGRDPTFDARAIATVAKADKPEMLPLVLSLYTSSSELEMDDAWRPGVPEVHRLAHTHEKMVKCIDMPPGVCERFANTYQPFEHAFRAILDLTATNGAVDAAAVLDGLNFVCAALNVSWNGLLKCHILPAVVALMSDPRDEVSARASQVIRLGLNTLHQGLIATEILPALVALVPQLPTNTAAGKTWPGCLLDMLIDLANLNWTGYRDRMIEKGVVGALVVLVHDNTRPPPAYLTRAARLLAQLSIDWNPKYNRQLDVLVPALIRLTHRSPGTTVLAAADGLQNLARTMDPGALHRMVDLGAIVALVAQLHQRQGNGDQDDDMPARIRGSVLVALTYFSLAGDAMCDAVVATAGIWDAATAVLVQVTDSVAVCQCLALLNQLISGNEARAESAVTASALLASITALLVDSACGREAAQVIFSMVSFAAPSSSNRAISCALADNGAVISGLVMSLEWAESEPDGVPAAWAIVSLVPLDAAFREQLMPYLEAQLAGRLRAMAVEKRWLAEDITKIFACLPTPSPEP
ncbi:hypothetical protein BC828DRAFT_182470 [Blastocladiella britannica]|nr:hypothetical protein BC828DRAFT_182470 [Blastocladiella britannica]